MIDIHPPQHGAMTLRDFFIHLGSSSAARMTDSKASLNHQQLCTSSADLSACPAAPHRLIMDALRRPARQQTPAGAP
jgi:hypothetical protein